PASLSSWLCPSWSGGGVGGRGDPGPRREECVVLVRGPDRDPKVPRTSERRTIPNDHAEAQQLLVGPARSIGRIGVRPHQDKVGLAGGKAPARTGERVGHPGTFPD